MTNPNPRLDPPAAPSLETMPEVDGRWTADSGSASDLGAVMATLMLTPEWRTEPRAARSIVHTPDLRVVMTALHQSADLQNDDPDEAVTIQGLRGSALLSINGRGAVVDEGTLVGIPAGSRWRLVATTDAAVLLTVVPV